MKDTVQGVEEQLSSALAGVPEHLSTSEGLAFGSVERWSTCCFFLAEREVLLGGYR